MVSQANDQGASPEPATHRETLAALFDFADALDGDRRYPDQCGDDLGSALTVLLLQHERMSAPDEPRLTNTALRGQAHLCPHGGGHWRKRCPANCGVGEKGGS